jgi:TolB protein
VSPDGKQIALLHNNGRGFRIAVQDLETGQVRVLTDGLLDESPSFAPNGTMIIYSTTYRGRGVLVAVSEDGQVREQLRLQEGDMREPAWGPFGGDS